MTAPRTGPQEFPHTRWSLVIEATQGASSQSAVALEADLPHLLVSPVCLCPRSGQSPHDAEDLTQEFFHRLLEKRWLANANEEKGKLRTFLITALKNFMANEWRRAGTMRRGGNRTHIPIDTVFAESRYAADPTAPLPADHLYERQWALNLLELTLERLRREFVTAGKSGDFEVLKESLMAVRGEMDYAAMAARVDQAKEPPAWPCIGCASVSGKFTVRKFYSLCRRVISIPSCVVLPKHSQPRKVDLFA